MKQFISDFCKRGLLAAAGGPVVLAIIYGILGQRGVIETLTPGEVCQGILTVILLAFVASGISAVYSVEKLPLFAAALIHGAVLYLDYILIYLLNGWLKQQLTAIAVFTGVFIVGYGILWLIIYLSIQHSTNRLNRKLKRD